MKLHTTLRSPYARKIYVMAIEKGLKDKIELVIEDLASKNTSLLKANPLAAVPTLILDDGNSIFDSTVIAEYIDSLNDNPKLIPADTGKRIYVMKIAALADGMVENSVALYYETLKADNLRDAGKVKKGTDILERCFVYAENELDNYSRQLTMAPIAIASAIGYMNFRNIYSGWEKTFPKLAQWYQQFITRPSMQQTMPGM